jgi:hypothetical protein
MQRGRPDGPGGRPPEDRFEIIVLQALNELSFRRDLKISGAAAEITFDEALKMPGPGWAGQYPFFLFNLMPSFHETLAGPYSPSAKFS